MKSPALLVLCLFSASAAMAQVSLPHSTDFESGQGFSLGSLDGQNDWSVDQGNAVVTASDSRSGSWSVRLQDSTPFTQIRLPLVDPGGQEVVAVDFYAKPFASDLGAKDEFIDVEGSLVGFFEVSPGVGEFYVFDGDGTGGGSWLATGYTATVDTNGVADDWIRITLYQNFGPGKKFYDLHLDDEPVAAGAGLIDGTKTFPAAFIQMGHTGGDAYFDQFFVGYDHPLFADGDDDGMDDAYENAHG